MAFALNAELKISRESLTAVKDKLQKLENIKINVTPVLKLSDIKQQIKEFNTSNSLIINLTPKLALSKKIINDQIKEKGDFDIRLNTIVNTKNIQKQLKDAGPFTVEVIPVVSGGAKAGTTNNKKGSAVNDVYFTGPSGNASTEKIKEITVKTNAAQKAVVSLDNAFEQVSRRKVFFQAPKIGSSRTELKALNKEIEAIDASYRKLNSVVHGSSETFDEFGQRVGISVKRFIAFSAGTSVLIGGFSAIKNSIGAAIDYEKEISKIAQVSESSLSSISKLRKEILSFSAAIGVDSKELAVSAATLAQTGIGLSKVRESIQAIGLARLSPSFGSAKDTIEGLIAVQAQFGKEAGPAIEILSKINAVSKAYAVESEDLVSAVQKSGGAFKTARGSFEQFIGTITAIRSTTRESADSIATGLRTIVARLQRPKTIDFLENVLGIDLREAKDRLKTLPIFDAIEKIREGISNKGLTAGDTILSQIIEEIGGIRQSSRVIPLLFDQGKANQATNLALASSESLALDAAIAQETLSNRLQKTIESFKLFGDTVLQDKGFRFFADTALNLANAIAKIGSALTPVIPLLGALAITTGLNLAPKLLGGVKKVGVRQFAQIAPRASGGPIYFGGSKVHGHKTANFGGQDNVPALLKPGEVVLNESQQKRIGSVSGLNRSEFFGQLGVPGFAKGGSQLPPRGKKADILKQIDEIAPQFGLKFEDLFSRARYFNDRELGAAEKRGIKPGAAFNPKTREFLFSEKTNKKGVQEEIIHALDLLLGGGEGLSSEQEGSDFNKIYQEYLPTVQSKLGKASKEKIQDRTRPAEVVSAYFQDIIKNDPKQFDKRSNDIALIFARKRAAADRARLGLDQPNTPLPYHNNYVEVGTNSFNAKFGKTSSTQDNLQKPLPDINNDNYVGGFAFGTNSFRAKTDDAYGKLHEAPSFSGDVNSSLPDFGKEASGSFKYGLPDFQRFRNDSYNLGNLNTANSSLGVQDKFTLANIKNIGKSEFALPSIQDNTQYDLSEIKASPALRKRIKRKNARITDSIAQEFSESSILDVLNNELHPNFARNILNLDQTFREGAREGFEQNKDNQAYYDQTLDFVTTPDKKVGLLPTLNKFLERRTIKKHIKTVNNSIEKRQARAFKDIGTNLFSNQGGDRKEGYSLSEVRKRFGFADGGIVFKDADEELLRALTDNDVQTARELLTRNNKKGLIAEDDIRRIQKFAGAEKGSLVYDDRVHNSDLLSSALSLKRKKLYTNTGRFAKSPYGEITKGYAGGGFIDKIGGFLGNIFNKKSEDNQDDLNDFITGESIGPLDGPQDFEKYKEMVELRKQYKIKTLENKTIQPIEYEDVLKSINNVDHIRNEQKERLKKHIRRKTTQGILLSQAPYKRDLDREVMYGWDNVDYLGQKERIKEKLKAGSNYIERINNKKPTGIEELRHLQSFSSDSNPRRHFTNSKKYDPLLHKDILEDFKRSEQAYPEPDYYANSSSQIDRSIKKTTADINSYITGSDYVKNFDLDKVKIKTKRVSNRVRNTKLKEDFISYSGLDELSSSVVEGTKTGGNFTLQRFLSTTLNKDVADNFLKSRQGKTILKIRNYKGQPGLPLQDEDEILLPNRSSFQIFNRKTREDGTEEVYVDRLANGGLPKVSGVIPGSGTGDKIPSMLTPGEVVLNQAQQRKLGGIVGTSPRKLFKGIGVPFQDRSGHYAGGVDLGSGSGSVFSGGSIGKFLGIQVVLDTLQALPDSLRPLSDIATATAGSFLVLDQTLKQSRGITVLNAQLEEVNTRFESSGKKLQIYASKIEASDKKIAAAQKARDTSKAETKKLAPELVAARQKQVKAQKEIEAINAGAVTPYGQKRNLTSDEVTRVTALKKEAFAGKITEVATRNKLSESVAATKNADTILKKEQATNKLIEERGKKQGAIHLKASEEQVKLDKQIGKEQKFGKRIQFLAAGAVGAGTAIDSYGQKLLEKKKDSYAATSGASGFLSGASSGASLGAFLGPKGAAIGAGVGAIFGGVKGFVSGKSELKAARQGSTQDFLESTLGGQEINGDALAQFNKDMKELSDSARSSNFGAILSKTGTVISGFGEGLLSFVPEGTLGLFGKAMSSATGALDNIVKYFGGNQLTKENTNLARKDEAFLLSQTRNIDNEGDLNKFVTQNKDVFKRIAENRGSDVATQEEAMKKLVLDNLKLKKTVKGNAAIIAASIDDMDQAFASIEEAFNQTQGFSSAIGAAAGAVKVSDRSSTLKNLSRVQNVDNFTNQLNVGTSFFGDYGKKVNNQSRQAAGNSGKIRELVKGFEKTDNLSGETISKALKENFSGLDPELYAKLENDIIKTFGAETGTTQIDKSKIDFKNAAESAVTAVTQGIGDLAAAMSKAATDAQNQLIGNLENVRNIRSQASDTAFQGFGIAQVGIEADAKRRGVNAGAGLAQLEQQRLGFYSTSTSPGQLGDVLSNNRAKTQQIQATLTAGQTKDALGSRLLSADDAKALSIEQNRLAAESENATKQLRELADVTTALSATERQLNEEEQRKGARKSIGDIEAFGSFSEKQQLERDKRNLADVASGRANINQFGSRDAKAIRDLGDQAGTSKLSDVFLGLDLGAGANKTGQNFNNQISQQRLIAEKVAQGFGQKDAANIANETYGTSAEERRLQSQQSGIVNRAQGAQQALAGDQFKVANEQENIALKQYDELFKRFADNQTKAAEMQLIAANEFKNVVNDMKKTVVGNGKVELGGQVKLDININGGQVLASIQPEIRNMVEGQIKAGINDFIQKKIPQVGRYS